MIETREDSGIHVDEHCSTSTGRDWRQYQGTSRPQPFPTLRRRRRRWVLALCAALVAAGGLGTAFAFTSVNDTQEVLVVSNDIKRGETIEAGDLAVVRVSVDPALTPVPGSHKAELEGSRAAVDLWAGTLLTAQAVTDNLVPGRESPW